MNTKAKRVLFIIFTLVCMVLVGFAADSYAKYVFSSSERIEGQYTDFCLTHDGANKSVILEEITDDDYTHVGYVTINLRNEDEEGNLSQRHILFNFVSVTTAQIAAGKVVDSWGEETPLLKDNNNNNYFSDYYDLSIINASGNPMVGFNDETGEPTKDSALYKQNYLKASPDDPNAVVQTTSVMLKVQRRKTKRSNESIKVPDLSTNSVESLDLVLKTFIPYIDLRVLQLNLTSSLIYVNAIEENYFTTDELAVNIKTSINYSMKIKETVDGNEVTNTYSSHDPVKLVFKFDSSKLLFDYERFRLSVEDNYKELENTNSYVNGYHYVNNSSGIDTLTLFVPAASDITLYFYIMKPSGCDISIANATFKLATKKADATDTHEYLSEVSGITSQGSPRLVYSN